MGDEMDSRPPSQPARGRRRMGGAQALPNDDVDRSAPNHDDDRGLPARADGPVDSDTPDASGPREGEGGVRRRRRRRRRGGGGPRVDVGIRPVAELPHTERVARDTERPRGARWGDGDEGGGRRRRRRRRTGSADVAGAPRDADAPREQGSVAAEGSRDRGSHQARRHGRTPEPAAPARAERFDHSDQGQASGRRSRRRRRRGGGGGEAFDAPEQRSQRADRGPANLLPDRDPFVDLVSIDPDERLELEIEPEDLEMRVLDIVTPIGKGQRALIVAPPKTGKTTLLMLLAKAIAENHPEVELIVMLIDERPEEVTAFKRAGYGTVMASSNDEPTARHLRLTQHVGDLARRMVLEGKDVCILLDSITRMARAHNVAAGGGRTMSGGLDTRALERPKRFFGAARNIAGGGSLTILATALIDTGSRMDEIIFQEFKGTGNCELQLDRRIAERRIWPAIDILRSGTRKEEKLFPPDEFEGVVALRRALSGKPPAEAMTMLLNRLKEYRTNREFLLEVARKAAAAS